MAAELNQKSITIAEVSTTVSIVSAAKVKPTTGSASAATDDTVTCFSRGCCREVGGESEVALSPA
jgi:hypothetical protein